MKKRLVIGCAVMLCLFSLTSCMKKKLPDLPDDAALFEMGTFEDVEHDDALFGTLAYNGRTYIAYGTVNYAYKRSCVDACVGFIVQDEHSSSVPDPGNTDRRVYTLSADPGHNYLMEYDDTVRLMNQPTFYRAVDTKGKEIATPDYIQSLGYAFWEEP